MLVWKAHAGRVHDLAFTPDGRLLTSADDATILWDAGTQTELRRWKDGYAVNLAVSPDGRRAAGAGHGDARWWSLDGNGKGDLGPGLYLADFVTFSPDGRAIIGHGGFDHLLHRWEVPGGEQRPRGWGGERTGREFSTGPLAFSPDGRFLATLLAVLSEGGAAPASVIVLRDAETGEERSRFWAGNTVPHATRLSFSPDGRFLASIHGLVLILWDVVSRIEYGRGRVSRKQFKGATFTADGSRLLTASNDTYLRVWSAPTWEQTTIYTWDAGKLGCVAVSGDGTVAAAGGSTGKVVVWDLE